MNAPSYAGLTPHFRQALAYPLEQFKRAELLDQLSFFWGDWAPGDYRWESLSALASILARRDDSPANGVWADALGRVIEAVCDVSRERSPMTVEGFQLALDELMGTLQVRSAPGAAA